ncbi:hypothetical protein DXD54_08205 [Clostridium sp. TM06-18]|nr:hypothetical protein [Clostridium sp. TM06-18]RHU37162.1 hypothetical protein DXD54_08205 [Clostridium sp. TM06-18]
MKKKWMRRFLALSLSAALMTGNASVTMAGDLPSYLDYVDHVENTKYPTSEIRGLVFPVTRVDAGNNTFWENVYGGTDYVLVYGGLFGDYKSAGYTCKIYPNGQSYPTFDIWTTPDGITVDYLSRVLDENGKIRTATAEQLGISYEAGKIRDVPYDANYPLKRVVDFYALNIEQITAANYNSAELNHHGLRDHNQFIAGNSYYISQLSGQPDNFKNDEAYFEDSKRNDAEAVVNFLRDWLNSFDFEHMSEMDRAKQIADLLRPCKYDFEAAAKRDHGPHSSYYRVLIERKGVCQDFTECAELLACLVGLKHAIFTANIDHEAYAIQVDGVPYGGDNMTLDLSEDWRSMTRLGTRQSLNYHYGEYIGYR